MLICFQIVRGCFCAKRAELNSCNGDRMAHRAENVYYQALYRKGLLIPDLG